MAEFKELNKSAIGARIRKRRELLGLSREELAEQLGVTAKFIGDIEYGEKGVSMKNLYRLKQILGVGADFLLEGAEDGISEEKEIKILQENIMGSLSVCSARHDCMWKVSSWMNRWNKTENKIHCADGRKI